MFLKTHFPDCYFTPKVYQQNMGLSSAIRIFSTQEEMCIKFFPSNTNTMCFNGKKKSICYFKIICWGKKLLFLYEGFVSAGCQLNAM